MKRSLLLLFLFFIACANLLADDFPDPQDPPRLVNDFAQMLNSNEVASLENKLLAYNDSTSTQIAVVTVPDLKGYDKSDYATRLFEKWKIGQKGKDNGILILLSKEEHAIWIETGYGMEGNFPDGVVKRIVDEIMIPNFRQGNFYQGLDEATSVIIQRASGEYKADENTKKKNKKGNKLWIVFIAVLIIISLVSRFQGNRYGSVSSRGFRGGGFLGGGFGGGGFGGGGGGFGGFGGGGSGGGGSGGNW